MSRYHMITISHFAKASGLTAKHSAECLRLMKRQGLLGSAGNIPLPGKGKAPLVYYLTKTGWDYLADEEMLRDELAEFVNTKPKNLWSQGMHHRLQTVTIIQEIDTALRKTDNGRIVDTRVDFRKDNHWGKSRSETTDFISKDLRQDGRIVPDAVACIERKDGARALVFIETDRGTEQVKKEASQTSVSIESKFEKYDKYLLSGRFKERYAHWGDFDAGIILFVTTALPRIKNIRLMARQLDARLHDYYRLTTHELIGLNSLGDIWVNRDASNKTAMKLLG